MEKMVKRISQVGVLVRDLDQAMKGFTEDFGIKEWNVLDFDKFPPLKVNGQPGKLNIKAAITTEIDNVEIELIQPTGEGPFADHLEKFGPGVHHFAVIMPDKNAKFGQVMERELAAGRLPWLEAEMIEGEPGEKMHFAYLDRREDMGVIMEVYDEARE